MNSATGEMEDVIEPGYVGKAKGWQQVIWERGLWVDGMQNRIEEDDEDGRDQRLSAYHVTAPLSLSPATIHATPRPPPCPRARCSATAGTLRMRPRRCRRPSAHEATSSSCASGATPSSPVLASRTVSWGKSAIHFRAQNNDCNPNHLYTNVLASLGRKNLPLITIFRLARRTREYGRTFAQLASSASKQTFALIEKTRKVFKCHRSSLDFDFRFIRSGGVVS